MSSDCDRLDVLGQDEVKYGKVVRREIPENVHIGLDKAEIVNSIEIRWPSGQVDTWKSLAANKLYVLAEGGKLMKTETLANWKK